MMEVFDPSGCELGEGPLWHPERESLFWFDIVGKRLYERKTKRRQWQFDEHFSAAGWIDRDYLMIASETGLWKFEIKTGAMELIVPLEDYNSATRSNDGRADPFGGFWIGTMGKQLEAGARAGAIYRYYKGEVRKLYSDIVISNSICFSPDGALAYFCDTDSKIIQSIALDADGWPNGTPQIFIDLRSENLNPDGSVVDASGNLWSAQWGASRVACYSPEGAFIRSIEVPTPQVSCPAFGGSDLSILFVTTAREGLMPNQLQNAGDVFSIQLNIKGQREHRVIL